MALGLSFGLSKKKVDTKTDVDKTETTNQTGNQTTSTAGTTTENQTGSQTTTGTNTGTSSQTGTSQQTGSQVGQTTQQTSQFSDPVFGALNGVVQQLLGGVGNHATVGNFDPDAFVAGGMQQANANQSYQLEDQINQMVTELGGTPETNSMAALLSNKMHGEAAANLAGINSQLTGQAQDIVRNNALAGNQIDQTGNQLLTQLTELLRGGQTTTTGTEAVNTSQAGQTTQDANTSEQQSQQQTMQQQTQTTQQLLQILNSLLTGTTHTVGTEHTKGTDNTMGGGVSASG